MSLPTEGGQDPLFDVVAKMHLAQSRAKLQKISPKVEAARDVAIAANDDRYLKYSGVVDALEEASELSKVLYPDILLHGPRLQLRRDDFRGERDSSIHYMLTWNVENDIHRYCRAVGCYADRAVTNRDVLAEYDPENYLGVAIIHAPLKVSYSSHGTTVVSPDRDSIRSQVANALENPMGIQLQRRGLIDFIKDRRLTFLFPSYSYTD